MFSKNFVVLIWLLIEIKTSIKYADGCNIIASSETDKVSNKTSLHNTYALRSVAHASSTLLTDLPSVLHVGRLLSQKVRKKF